jgi:hypothetical protein
MANKLPPAATKPSTTSDVEIKGPADFRKMAPDEFEAVCKVKHAEIRSFCSGQVIDAVQKHLAEGKPIESLFVGLVHIGEQILPEESKMQMKASNIEIGCLPIDRYEFAENIASFVHPQTNQKCYEPLAAQLQTQTPGHFYVGIFALQNATLTRVRLEELQDFHKKKLEREAARAAKIAEREGS